MIKLSTLGIPKIKTLAEHIKYYTILLESPTRIPRWTSDKLYNRTENYAFCKLIREKGRRIDKYKEMDVYQFTNGQLITDIFAADDFIQAYFNYEIKNNVAIEKRVWQDELQRGLCRDIIFNYYLSKYSGIMSDGLHSPLGEKYWNKLLKQSQELGYKIFAIDISDNRAGELNIDDIDKFYSNNISSENYRFLIKNK